MEELKSSSSLGGKKEHFSLERNYTPAPRSCQRQAGPMTRKLLHLSLHLMFRLIIKAVEVREETLYSSHVSKYYCSRSSARFGSFIYNTILAFCSRDVRGSLHCLCLNYFIFVACIGVETFLLSTV